MESIHFCYSISTRNLYSSYVSGIHTTLPADYRHKSANLQVEDAQDKRWRDSRDFQHDADSATSPFSSLFLISKIENVGDGDENAILAFNEPCDGSDFTRRRKKPRVENDILPTAPAGIHHHQSVTTSEVSPRIYHNKRHTREERLARTA